VNIIEILKSKNEF